MSPPLLVAVYALLTLVASLAGGWIPALTRLSHAGMQALMSFVAGLMLGVGVFHMVPHAVHALPHTAAGALPIDQAMWWVMIGLLATFFLQRFFHFHQHEVPGAEGDGEPAGTCQDDDHRHDHDHAPGDHGATGHHHPHDHLHGASETAALGWVGIALGLVLHTLMDGVALAASVESEAHVHGDHTHLAGVGVFLAIFLHKPLDALAITALMQRDGWPRKTRLLVNALFALICPIGAGLFYVTVGRVAGGQSAVIGCALAFSAGAFLCISLSDLLPEIQFHAHDRIKLSLALALGIVLAYAIGFFEESGHGVKHSHTGHGHESHADHNHSHH